MALIKGTTIQGERKKRTRRATTTPTHQIIKPPPGGTSLQRLLPPPPPTKQEKADRRELDRAIRMKPKERVHTYGFEVAETLRRAELAASIETQPQSPTRLGARTQGTTAKQAAKARRDALEAAIDETGLFDVARTSRARPTGKPRAVLDYAAEALVGHNLRHFSQGEDYSVKGLVGDLLLLPTLVLPVGPIRGVVAGVRGAQAAKAGERGVEAAIRTLAPEERRLLRLGISNANAGRDLNYAQRSVFDKVFSRTGRIAQAMRAGYGERPIREAASWATGKLPWGTAMHKMMKGIPAGTRIIIDLEDDLVGAHRMSGELVEASKTRLKWIDDDHGPQSIPYGRVIQAGRADDTSWSLFDDLPSKEEMLGRIGAPSQAVHASSTQIADEFLGSPLAATMPERLQNADELTAAIDKVYQLAREGAEHRDWYARAASVATRFAEAYDIEPRTAAQLMAIFSTGNDPTPNMLHAVQAVEQFQAGEKIQAGLYPASQSKEAYEALTSGWTAKNALKGEGRKRYSFYSNMLRHLDPDEYERVLAETGRSGHPVTVDMWVVRMFAPWQKKDVPEGAYDAFEEILTRMANEMGWDPEEVQAAAWVAAKARGILGSEIRRGSATGNIRRVPMERAVERGRDAYETGLSAYVRGYRPGAVEEVRGGVSRLRPIEERPTPSSARDVRGRGERADIPEFTEHSSTRAGIARFRDALRRNPNRWSLSDPPPRVLRNSRLFLTADGEAGYAIGIDGELHSVFRNPDGVRGAGREATIQAASRGAYWLNAYDQPKLLAVYEEAGFVPVARIKYDPALAHPDAPEADVIFMSFGARPHPERTFDDWDDAVRYTREMANPANPAENLQRPGFDIAPSVTEATRRFREEATREPVGMVAFADEAGAGAGAADEIPPLPPDEQLRLTEEGFAKVRKAARGSKEYRDQQALLRAEEIAARAKAADEAMRGLEGEEALLAARQKLRGKLPQVEFGGLRDLDHATWELMVNHIVGHPDLMTFEKQRAFIALTKMVRGQLPQANEVRLLNQVFGKGTVDSLKAERAKLHMLQRSFIQLYHFPRTMMSTFDLSAPLRQGLVTAVRHPRVFTRNFMQMHKMWAHEGAYENVMRDIVERPSWPLMRRHRLALTDLGEEWTQREELFMSDWAEVAFGLGKKTRGPVRMSSRAYTGFLNKTRADLFDAALAKSQRWLETQGYTLDTYPETDKMLDDLARVINSATGRGEFGKSQFARDLHDFANYFLFSPRLLASRINFLNPYWYARLHPQARKEAISSFAAMVGMVSFIAGLAKMGGASVEVDPRSSDFAKIKVGDTRIDLLGGFQQPVRYGAQIITGTVISPVTGLESKLTAGGFGDPNRMSTFFRFLRSKLAPMPSLVVDWATGKDFIGQPFDAKKAAYERMIPILATDLIEMKQQGQSYEDLLQFTPAIYGVGMQHYQARPGRAEGEITGDTGDLDELDQWLKEQVGDTDEFDEWLKQQGG